MKRVRRAGAAITLTGTVLAVCASLLPASAGGWCQDVALKVRGRTVIEKTTACVPPCIYGAQVDLACSARKRG